MVKSCSNQKLNILFSPLLFSSSLQLSLMSNFVTLTCRCIFCSINLRFLIKNHKEIPLIQINNGRFQSLANFRSIHERKLFGLWYVRPHKIVTRVYLICQSKIESCAFSGLFCLVTKSIRIMERNDKKVTEKCSISRK